MKNKRIYILFAVLCILLLLFWYKTSNPDKILAFRAEQEFKRNNIPQAQEYLEQAFDLGVKDYDLRELYLNSLINSPFDEKSPAKLLKFIEYPVDDDIKLRAEYFIQDFQREINKKYPDNYITQAVYNQQIMRWNEIPISYGFINTQNVPEYFIEEIENAFNKWEIATDHQILFSREQNNPNIIINFNAVNPADSQNQKYVVAYATPELNLNILKHSVINFYLKDPNGEYYSPNQVYNTALHEIVHAIGVMGHSSDKEDIMHPTKDSQSLINDTKSELTEADINTVKLLYRIKPDITNSNNSKGDYTPFIVLGGAEMIQKAKMREAVSYVKSAPKLAGGYMDLAESYVNKKDYVNARKYLKKALSLADSEEVKGMVYFNIAVVEYYSENYTSALKYLIASIRIKDSADSRYLLAEIYAQQGEISKAVKEYQKLIAKHPDNIEYVCGLTNLYIKDKKYVSARKVLKRYFKAHPNERKNPRFDSYGIITMFL